VPHALESDEQEVFGFAQGALNMRRIRLREGDSLTPELIREVVRGAPAMTGVDLDDAQVIRVVRNLEEVFIALTDVDAPGAILEAREIPAWVPASKPAVKWRFWYRYHQFLMQAGKISPRDIQELHGYTDQILDHIGNPAGTSLDGQPHPATWSIRGMVFGSVQSGKTSNYSGLICKAADAGYKVIVVLTGMHEDLRTQTQERIDENFIGHRSLGDPGKGAHQRVGVGKIRVPGAADPTVYWATHRNRGGDFGSRRQIGMTLAPDAPTLILVVKKNAHVLRHLLSWIVGDGLINTGPGHIEERLMPVPQYYAHAACPLLIIDDEADQASVDTARGAIDDGGAANDAHDPKTINRLIRAILRCFPRSSYVGYTATPFANILIHEDGFSQQYGQDLFPRHFIISLPRPKAYVGPATIFGRADELDDAAGDALEGDGDPGEGAERRGLPDLIRIVEDHATPPDDLRAREGWMPPLHWTDHRVGPLPDSVTAAIRDFTLAGAALAARGMGKRHHSMLIHVTRFQNVMNELHQRVNAHWQEWSTQVLNGDPVALTALKRRWNDSFLASNAAVRRKRPWEQGIEPIPWETLITPERDGSRSPLQTAVDGVEVMQIHGGRQGQQLDYRSGQLKVIAIGGGKLSRGLTLENLTVSYFLRTSRMYDSLMQMGRWFGYRPGYLDLCRLYLQEDLFQWFQHMTDASEELRGELERMQARNATPQEYGLRVRSHPVMQVTSSVKMQNATQMRVGFSNTRPETISFITKPAVIRGNFKALSSLIKEMGPGARDPVLERPDARNEDDRVREQTYLGWQWEHVPAPRVIRFLRSMMTSETATVANASRVAQYIEQLTTHDELTEWTVFLRSNPRSERTDTLPHAVTPGRSRRGRSPTQNDPERRGLLPGGEFAIKVLIDSDYETVDIDLAGYREALEEKRRASRRAGREQAPTRPGGAVRDVRPPERGLLLLYTVQPYDPADTKRGFERTDILTDPDLPLVGFAISFPRSGRPDDETAVSYTVNNVYREMEIEFGLDDED